MSAVTLPDAAPRAVGIVGLGLIGGSLALDLAALGVRVLAHDADERSVRQAMDAGVVEADLGTGLERLAEVDLLVVSVPVDRAPDVLVQLAARPDAACPVTDTASTKQSLLAAAQRLGLGTRFVGAHPLAGDHRSGWGAARAGLFRDALVYVCPGADARAAAIAPVERLWRSVGARPVRIDAGAHDRLLARTSHLPQILASALARVHAAAGIDAAQLGSGGRDMTRLAASDPELWRAILLDNADAVLPSLLELERTVQELRGALDRRDAPAVRAWLAGGQRGARGQGRTAAQAADGHGADSAPPRAAL